MELLHFIHLHPDAFAYLLLFCGLAMTAFEIHHLVKSQRVSNLLTITRDHRDIWSKQQNDPALQRVLLVTRDVEKEPVSHAETLFVTYLILHLKGTYVARQHGMLMSEEALGKDLEWFFSLPVPKAVWKKSKSFHDRKFAGFVDRSMKKETSSQPSPF